MSGSVFWPAVWIGLCIAAPVGPIGLLVIGRTLQHGLGVGLATGLGAAVADAAYGAVGAFGVTALMAWLQGLRVPLVLVGSAFLLWLAWRTWRAAPTQRPAAAAAPPAVPALWPSFASTFLLTLSNPATLLSFMAIFGALAAQQQGVASPALMVAGVLVGSALWWLALCAAVARWRQKMATQAQVWVARVSALMLAAFALWQLAQLWPLLRQP